MFKIFKIFLLMSWSLEWEILLKKNLLDFDSVKVLILF